VNGGSQRTNLLFRALSTIAKIDFLLLAAPDPRHTTGLKRDFGLIAARPPAPAGKRKPWRAVRALAPKLIDRLAHNMAPRRFDYLPDLDLAALLRRRCTEVRYDAIVCRYLATAARAGAFGLAPVFVDVDDFDTEVYRTRLDSPGTGRLGRLVVRRHLAQLERLLPTELSRCTHVWVASDLDLPKVDHPSASILHNVPFEPPLLPAPDIDANPPVFLTVASFNHAANVRGIEYFLQEVWPQIRTEVPNAIYRLAGSGLTTRHHYRWSTLPGVEVIGPFETASTVYEGATLAVVPIFEGGGTKIKVLEALAYGRCVIASRHAFQGYERSIGAGGAVVVDSKADFAKACVALVREPDRRRRFAAEGYRKVTQHFSYQAFSEQALQPLLRYADSGTSVGRNTVLR
jgi:glycosyltransferase involved in cell wall biosynthesis